MASWASRMIAKIRRGRSLHGFWVGACSSRKGLLSGEELLEVCVKRGDYSSRIFYLTVFPGRNGYRGWAEVHGIAGPQVIGGHIFRVHGSWVEDWVVGVASSSMGPGGRFFYEYYGDSDTLAALERGYPIVASRLGYRLLSAGFTWLKDMYYAEGFREGGVKLLAEKPLGLEHKRRHLVEHREELQGFIDSQCKRSRKDRVLEASCRRARLALRDIRSMLSAL